MVETRYRCGICFQEQKSFEEAEKCEKKGEYPAMPNGTVYTLPALDVSCEHPLLYVLGQKTGVQEGTHFNLHYAAHINDKNTYCSLVHLAVAGDGTTLRSVRSEDEGKKVLNPKEDLKNHPGCESLLTILEEPDDIRNGIKKVKEKLEARLKQR